MLTLALLLVLSDTQAPAQDARAQPFPITLSFDPYRSIDTGADMTFGAASALSMLEDRVFSHVTSRLRTALPLGIAKTVLVDHPLAVFLIVLQHEVFGHGGRARELGSRAAFQMGSPWKADTLFKGGTRFGGGARWDQLELPRDRMTVIAGGTEANTRSATIVERELVAGRAAHPVQLLYYIRSRWYASQYVLRTPHPVSDPRGFFEESHGGDVATYLGELNALHYGETGITPTSVSRTLLAEYRRLRRHALINLAGPGPWLAWWAVAHHTTLGEQSSIVPMFRIGTRRFLPSIDADWLVDGGALSIEAIVAPSEQRESATRWWSVVARHGNGPAGRFWGVGGATEKFAAWNSLRMGGEIEMWKQPSFGFGAGANARIVVTRGRPKGLFFQLGLKNDGHWPGRPIKPGGFIRVGYRYVKPY